MTENFADKWQIYPERKKAFGFFISELQKDIINNTFLISEDIFEESNSYKEIFGTKIVENAFANIAGTSRTLREGGNMYINKDSKINFDNKGTNVKDHKFFGK